MAHRKDRESLDLNYLDDKPRTSAAEVIEMMKELTAKLAARHRLIEEAVG